MGLTVSALLAALLAVSPTSVSAIAAGQVSAGVAPEQTTIALDNPAGDTPARDKLDGAALWQWPVDDARRIVRPFIAPATKYSAGHRGVDIGAPPGTTVRAPARGVVHFAGVVVDRPVVSIRHEDGAISSFEPVISDLAEGSPVARGSPIGIAQSGHCATGCIHFGVRVHGEYVSPLLYFDGVPRAVLLPTRP